MPGRISRRLISLVGVTALTTVATPLAALAAGAQDGSGGPSGGRSDRHVLLLSVDGMHQSDLDRYVETHPRSALARLTRTGVSYTGARAPAPSDSFPGLAAQVTGGNPRSTGIYYDVSYNRSLLAPGTTTCSGATPGTAVAYDESIDLDPTRLDAGQGLPGLPGSILRMTGHPQTLINRSLLPVDPATCHPVLPHSYLKVNTVFEVAKAAGLRTAWSDKHAAYDLVNGPSGSGVDDLFTPEVNSDAPAGGDWASINASTQQYDAYKVKAVLNELDGRDHSGVTHVGVPAILGMNFQSVSTAQKLPTSGGEPGGYLAGGTTPGPVLKSALSFVNDSIGQMLHEIESQGLSGSTTIILSAKHGQSPTDPTALTRIDDAAVVAGLNAAWKAQHPSAADLVTFSINDDSMLLWLSNRSPVATSFAKGWLLSHPATGNTIDGASRTLAASGLTSVYAGVDAARFYGVSVSEERHPDLVGVAQHGVVYTGGTKKIAEHGGMDPQDRHVPLVVATLGHDGAETSGNATVAGTTLGNGRIITAPVETTQIAPTILRALGLEPRALQAVRLEGTRPLPGGLDH